MKTVLSSDCSLKSAVYLTFLALLPAMVCGPIQFSD